MHQVCRKYQGIPWEPAKPAGMKANVSMLVRHEGAANPEPFPKDTCAVAFDARSYPKLVSEMTGASLVLRQKSLRLACQQMSAPKEIASFLEAGIVEALNMAGRDEDDEVRVLTTTALARLAREPNARAQMLLAGSVGVLLQLALPEKEKVEAVRANCLAAIVELARAPEASAASEVDGQGMTTYAACAKLIEAGCVPQLVETTPREAAALQGVSLRALRGCMLAPLPGALAKAGLQQAVEAGAIPAMIQLLETAAVREQAAYCLAALTVELEEKAAARKAAAISTLVGLVRSETASLRKMATDGAALTAVLAALASLTVENEGKIEAMAHQAYEDLLPLLEVALALEMRGAMTHATCTMTVNLTKCIANLAEHPKGRKKLQPALQPLEQLCSSTEPLVRKHAQSAVERVTWKP